MEYQISLEGKNATQEHIQLTFKNETNFNKANETAGKFKLEYKKYLLGEEYIPETISLLFSDRAQAITDGVPEKEIKHVWPDKPGELYRYVLYNLKPI